MSSATGTSSALAMPVWPADTNLVFLPGTRKVTLTCQRPVVCVVVQDGMEKVRADLLFNHAFPDPAVALFNIREALLSSALQRRVASDIHRRLVFDDDYMDTLVPLVRSAAFLNPCNNTADSIIRYVLAFCFSEAKSKSDATQSSYQMFWPLDLRIKLNPISRSKSLIITTLF